MCAAFALQVRAGNKYFGLGKVEQFFVFPDVPVGRALMSSDEVRARVANDAPLVGAAVEVCHCFGDKLYTASPMADREIFDAAINEIAKTKTEQGDDDDDNNKNVNNTVVNNAVVNNNDDNINNNDIDKEGNSIVNDNNTVEAQDDLLRRAFFNALVTIGEYFSSFSVFPSVLKKFDNNQKFCAQYR